MSMTLEQILRKTPKDRRLRSKDGCRVLNAKLKKGTARKTISALIQDVNSSTLKSGQPRKHKTEIHTLTGGKLGQGAVKVSCDCEDFTYTWEVALKRKGAADIRYSNGDPPTDTNPRMIPGCCKHVYKLGRYVLNKGM